MKYSSFAIVAALFAAGSLASSSMTLAADKPVAVHGVSGPASARPAADLYAQAPMFNEGSATRLDGQLMTTAAPSAAATRAPEEPVPFNLMALVVAGLAVMGSLAFRRAPNK